jgi:hypothetical protein
MNWEIADSGCVRAVAQPPLSHKPPQSVGFHRTSPDSLLPSH